MRHCYVIKSFRLRRMVPARSRHGPFQFRKTGHRRRPFLHALEVRVFCRGAQKFPWKIIGPTWGLSDTININTSTSTTSTLPQYTPLNPNFTKLVQTCSNSSSKWSWGTFPSLSTKFSRGAKFTWHQDLSAPLKQGIEWCPSIGHIKIRHHLPQFGILVKWSCIFQIRLSSPQDF